MITTTTKCNLRLVLLLTSLACLVPAPLQAQTYAGNVLATPNLLGYWPFSTASQADSVVNGYTGTFLGHAMIGFPSMAGSIFTIAGESQVGNDFDLQIETDNKLKFYTDSGSATTDTNAFTTNDLGRWFFVAGTFTASTSRSLYVDGQLVASSVPGAHAAPGSGTFAIGESDVFTGRYFQGSLDEIAVFNREITAAEVAGFYAVAGFGSTVILAIASQPNDSLLIHFVARPNSTNVLQATAGLQPPIVWQTIATNIAAANGAGQFSNMDKGTYPARFYRVATP